MKILNIRMASFSLPVKPNTSSIVIQILHGSDGVLYPAVE